MRMRVCKRVGDTYSTRLEWYAGGTIILDSGILVILEYWNTVMEYDHILDCFLEFLPVLGR